MRKVLVVEDHPDMRELLVWQMELMGFSAIPAKHGKEGVEKAMEEKPQLILMDIMMPVMDGREATRILRSNPVTQDIPILAATALFRESELNSCIEAGCNDYLVKPFTFQELRGKIQEYVPMPEDAIQ
ncbi:MAG TPA: response regulator [Candidatus Binatia bacterium]|jgi:two-component system alkaline phosphatase synthesis response regulator PhoP|nr:response regulator [Candidatus Binatia bacterium]